METRPHRRVRSGSGGERGTEGDRRHGLRRSLRGGGSRGGHGEQSMERRAPLDRLAGGAGGSRAGLGGGRSSAQRNARAGGNRPQAAGNHASAADGLNVLQWRGGSPKQTQPARRRES